MNARDWSNSFGPIVSPSSFEFHGPTTEAQGARALLLRDVVQLIGADRTPDVYVELVRYLETGLRTYDDPTPGPPSVDELERVREAAFGALCRRGLAPDHARDVAGDVVNAAYPGVAG